jgi:Helix-turn-helix domain
MAVLSMSKQEFSRLDVLLRFQSGRLRVEDACALIGLRRRQVFRLLRGLKQEGATSLLSKRRGKPGNHRLLAVVRTLALSLVRERYADFGPTFAAEKLAEVHGCSVSRETLRGWMIADGLWVDRWHRLPSPHQPPARRDCLGELVQIDGSEHAWFETRGEACTLLAFVDDATSRLCQRGGQGPKPTCQPACSAPPLTPSLAHRDVAGIPLQTPVSAAEGVVSLFARRVTFLSCADTLVAIRDVRLTYIVPESRIMMEEQKPA